MIFVFLKIEPKEKLHDGLNFPAIAHKLRKKYVLYNMAAIFLTKGNIIGIKNSIINRSCRNLKNLLHLNKEVIKIYRMSFLKYK